MHQEGAALLLMLVIVVLGTASLFTHVFRKDRSASSKVQVTYAKLGDAKEALIGFAMTHGRLPRPAISALDGHENPEPCTSAEKCTGLLPWLTLAVSPYDGWGKQLHYSVAVAFTEEPILSKFAVANKSVLSRDNMGKIYYRKGQNDCSVTSPCAPAIIYSSGKSNSGVSATGILLLNPTKTNIDEQFNTGGVNTFITRPKSESPADLGGEFDHYLVWLSLPELDLRMNVSGVLP